MTALWEEIGRERYGVTDPKYLRMRYGVQVNSLGLTESQPENNVPRIVLEALAVTLGRDARARAIQLPAWNEALGLPRPWDQQWSLRIQQILANETDLLDYPDIFEGSKVMDGLVAELPEGARAEMAVVEQQGGAVEAVPYMKARLVESHRERMARIEGGEIKVVGQNSLHGDRGLAAHRGRGRRHPHPRSRGRARVPRGARAWQRRARRGRSREGARRPARGGADEQRNIMPATIEAAKAGVTTGEWAQALRDAFGDYRAPTGVGATASGASEELLAGDPRARGRGLRGARAPDPHPGRQAGPRRALERRRADRRARARCRHGGHLPGHPPHARADRASARDEDVDVVGLSILSGSHRELIPETVRLLRERGVDAPVVVGGIIPPADEQALLEAGVARVYTPKDFEINRIMGEIVELVASGPAPRRGHRRPACTGEPPADRVSRRGPHATASSGFACRPMPTCRGSSRRAGTPRSRATRRSRATTSRRTRVEWMQRGPPDWPRGPTSQP